ncbi:hypothetical protein QZH41_017782, partial [Actinostola sp. cb2023]
MNYLFLVNGGWGPYGSYGSCSKTCGGGYQKRYRKCNKPKQQYGGKPCSGSNSQTGKCNGHVDCPVNGGWGPYGSYGSCSKTCGGGYQKRYRKCNKPKQQYGGKPCSGSNSQTGKCNGHIDCPEHMMMTMMVVVVVVVTAVVTDDDDVDHLMEIGAPTDLMEHVARPVVVEANPDPGHAPILHQLTVEKVALVPAVKQEAVTAMYLVQLMGNGAPGPHTEHVARPVVVEANPDPGHAPILHQLTVEKVALVKGVKQEAVTSMCLVQFLEIGAPGPHMEHVAGPVGVVENNPDPGHAPILHQHTVEKVALVPAVKEEAVTKMCLVQFLENGAPGALTEHVARPVGVVENNPDPGHAPILHQLTVEKVALVPAVKEEAVTTMCLVQLMENGAPGALTEHVAGPVGVVENNPDPEHAPILHQLMVEKIALVEAVEAVKQEAVTKMCLVQFLEIGAPGALTDHAARPVVVEVNPDPGHAPTQDHSLEEAHVLVQQRKIENVTADAVQFYLVLNSAIIGFAKPGQSVKESVGSFKVQVKRSGATKLSHSASVKSVDGTAQSTNPADFVRINPTTITFGPNDAVKEVTVTILEDKIDEKTENFRLVLSSSDNRVTISRAVFNINIRDNDVDGNWGAWTPFTKCSKPCGRGSQSRSRKCDNPAPQGGGRPCAGPSSQSRRCYIKRYCPNRHRVQTPKVRHQVQTQVQDDEVATNIDMVVGMVVGMVVDMVVGMAKQQAVIGWFHARVPIGRFTEDRLMEDGAPTDLMDHVVKHVVAAIRNDTEYVTNQSHSTEVNFVLVHQRKIESVIPDTVQFYLVLNSAIIGFAKPGQSVKESVGSFKVQVKRSGATKLSHSASVKSVDGTAQSTNPADFVRINPTTITFGPNDAVKEVTVTILEDKIDEKTENFRLVLSSSDNRVTISRAVFNINIRDND